MLFLSENPFASSCKISSLVITMCLATGLEVVSTEEAFASQEASSLSEHGEHCHTVSLAWSSTDRSARLQQPQVQPLHLCCFLSPGAGVPGSWPAASAKGCPQLCTAGVGRHSVQSGSIHHRATAPRTVSLQDEPPATLARPRCPRPHSPLSVNSG